MGKMAKIITFEIKGIEEFQRMLKQKNQNAMQKADEALKKIGQYMMDRIK